MRDLLIDVTRLLGRQMDGRLPTGVDRVSLEYIRHFDGQGQALVRYGGRWIVLDGADSARVFDALLEPKPHFGATVRWCVGKGYALNWGGRIPRLLLNTGHSGLDHSDYAERVRRFGLRPLFFLHDLIPISHPEYCRPGEAEKHRRRLETMLSVGCGLVFNSEATRRALVDHAAASGRLVPPGVVARLAPASLPAPNPDRPLAEPYFVVLGTIEPRKNHWMLLHLWRQLAETLGAEAPRLVVIGQRGWECEQVVDLLDRCEALRGLVIEKPACGDAELATWLHHSQALLFPSFVEGYGIPVLEALALGVPVIASDLVVFRELAHDVPEYLNPLDGAAWKQAVLIYASSDSPVRRAQIARMAGFRAPTWAEHFERVETLMSHCRPDR